MLIAVTIKGNYKKKYKAAVNTHQIEALYEQPDGTTIIAMQSGTQVHVEESLYVIQAKANEAI